MRSRSLRYIGITGVLFLCAAVPAQVAPNLDAVVGINKAGLTKGARALLQQNGFVVVPRYYHRIFGPYLEKDLPPYITADSVHRTFHVIFEDLLQAYEAHARERMAKVISEMRDALAGAPEDEGVVLARQYFDVADHLVRDAAPPKDEGPVARELALIHEAAGAGPSPLFGYPLDYTQFAPRGFYTNTPELRSYFRTMGWLGTAAFRLKSDVETEAARVIARTFAEEKSARATWNALDQTYTALMGACDDLTVEEYARVLEGEDAAEGLEAFRAATSALRDPQYNSMVSGAMAPESQIEETKGMRFMGQRYLPDGELFESVTHPKVPGRGFPGALDVLAANGSARARHYLEATAPGKDYERALASAAERLAADKAAQSDSHYLQVFGVMEALTAPPVDAAPAFAKTEAYADKNLTTAAAAWASMRHAWVLHAKQNVVFLGGEMPPKFPGYIEPNPEFFRRMSTLTSATIDLFKGVRSPERARLRALDQFLGLLSNLLKLQLADRPLPPWSTSFFNAYATKLIALQGHQTNHPVDEAFPWMALVADVFTDLQSVQCLEVATGGAMPIYVVVEHEGTPLLLKGAVYTYFEFMQPMTQRLTDEAWHARWDAGELPPAPRWTATYVSGGPNIDDVIARLQAGEIVPEAAFMNDVRLIEINLETLGAQAPAEKGDARSFHFWASDLAVRKAPDLAKPILIERLRTIPCPDYEGEAEKRELRRKGEYNHPETYEEQERERLVRDQFSALRQRVMEVGLLLGDHLTAADLDLLWEIANSGDPNRAAAIIAITIPSTNKACEGFWIRAAKELPGKAPRRHALSFLALLASPDVTPALLEMVHTPEGKVYPDVLLAMAKIWTTDMTDSAFRKIETNASREELELWEAELRPVVVAYFEQLLDPANVSDFDYASEPYTVRAFAARLGVDIPDGFAP